MIYKNTNAELVGKNILADGANEYEAIARKETLRVLREHLGKPFSIFGVFDVQVVFDDSDNYVTTHVICDDKSFEWYKVAIR